MTTKKLGRFADAEVLVVGGGLHAVEAALASVRVGRETALVMSTTSPAVEIGSSMGAWLTAPELALIPPKLRDALLDGADQTVSTMGVQYTLLDQRRAVTAVEDLLLDSGVRLFYDAHPIGLLATGPPGADRVAVGALFGGKFGVAAATASATIDCSVDARLARTSGTGTWVGLTDADIHAAYFLTDGDNRHEAVRFHEGVTVSQRGPLAEFRFRTDSPELVIRRTIIRGMKDWNTSHPDSRFAIERGGDTVLTQPARRLDSEGWAGPAKTGIAGFFCAGPAADASPRRESVSRVLLQPHTGNDVHRRGRRRPLRGVPHSRDRAAAYRIAARPLRLPAVHRPAG